MEKNLRIFHINQIQMQGYNYRQFTLNIYLYNGDLRLMYSQDVHNFIHDTIWSNLYALSYIKLAYSPSIFLRLFKYISSA